MQTRLATVIALGCAAFLSHTAVQAAPLAHVRTTVSDLAYQITDLGDLGRPQPPSILFPATDGVRLEVGDGPTFTQAKNDTVVIGLPFSPSGGGVGGSGPAGQYMSAIKNGPTLITEVSYSVDEVNTLLTGPYGPVSDAGQALLGFDRFANIYAQPGNTDDSQEGFEFTLAAHTAVTFTGRIRTETSVDLSQLLGTAAYAKAVEHGATIRLTASSSAMLYMLGCTPSCGAFGSEYGRYTLDAQGQLGHVGSAPVDQTFSITFANEGPAPLTHELNLDMTALMRLSVTSVPEADGWAMWALGLVGLAFAGRHKKRKH